MVLEERVGLAAHPFLLHCAYVSVYVCMHMWCSMHVEVRGQLERNHFSHFTKWVPGIELWSGTVSTDLCPLSHLSFWPWQHPLGEAGSHQDNFRELSYAGLVCTQVGVQVWLLQGDTQSARHMQIGAKCTSALNLEQIGCAGLRQPKRRGLKLLWLRS